MGLSEFYSRRTGGQEAATIRYAFERGVCLFDTADMYGHGENEQLVGSALRPFRRHVSISSKFGIVRDGGIKRIDTTPEYVKRACEASLRRLQTDWIDLYYVHRLDPATPVEDTIGAMIHLVEQGKIRAIGLSKLGLAALRRAHAISPIHAVQMEYSLMQRELETDLLPYCRLAGITVVAYSPLCKGLLTGLFAGLESLDAADWRRKDPRFTAAGLAEADASLARLARLAGQRGCTPAQAALAWVGAHSGVVPLPGMRTRAQVDESVEASGLELSPEEMRLLEGGAAPDSGIVYGESKDQVQVL
jgi:aryl-alcohol dehydrogenase-like predicted oxidoreductase